MVPNTPEQVWLTSKDYAWRKDWSINGWLMIAAIVSGAADIVFPHVVRTWPLSIQTLAAVLPFIAILLWARSLSVWIKGMDELHRRITVSAVLFSVSATAFVLLLWHRLEKAGLWQAIPATRTGSSGNWDIGTVAHAALLLTLFYAVGHSRFNRRYQ